MLTNKKIMKLTFIIYFITYTFIISQSVSIVGTIINKNTSQPIPYVNIGVQGTYFGTSSNEKGQFKLSFKRDSLNLVISCIGFKTKIIQVDIHEQSQIIVKLEPISIELPEVIVNAEENPAYAIIRKAIANKYKNKKGLKNYFYNFYSKNILKSGKKISFIEEDTGEGFNKLPKKIVELKTKIFKSENLSEKTTEKLFTKTDLNFLEKKIIDFTADSLILGKFVFHLPLSQFAFDYYDYKLKDLQQNGTHLFYNIEVIPLSKIRPTFKGSIIIEDSSYALTGLNLTMQNRNLMPYTEFKMTIIQNLTLVKKYWLPKYYNIDVEFNFNYSYLIGIDSLITSYVKLFNNPEINLDPYNQLLKNINKIDDSTFIKNPEFITSKQMDSIRLYPLSLSETEAYKNIDSTNNIVSSLKFTGVAGNYLKRKNLVTTGSRIKNEKNNNKSHFNFGKLFKFISFQNNRVDGIELGIKHSSWVADTVLHYSAGAGYSIERNKVNANLSFYLPINFSLANGIELTGNYGTKPFHIFSHYPSFWNSVGVTLGFEDQFNYYNSLSGSIKIEKTFIKNTLLKVGIAIENQKPLAAKRYYSIFNSKRAIRINPNIKENNDNRIVLNFNSGKFPYYLNFMMKNGFVTQIDISSKVLGSDFNYTRINSAYQFYLKTLYNELFFSPYLSVFIELSAVFGDFGIQHLYTPKTALGIYSPLGTFKALQPYQLIGDKSLAVHLEHNWRKTFFDMLGIYFPVAWNIELTTGVNFLAMHTTNSPYNTNQDVFYWEIYGGISGILGIINVNVAYGKYKNTVVRLSLSKFF